MFSESETAQIGYDAGHKVVTISVDYAGGIGAPDPKAVVVGELEKSVNGSMCRTMRYKSLGSRGSYNRTTGAVPTVTVTIHKLQRGLGVDTLRRAFRVRLRVGDNGVARLRNGQRRLMIRL